MSTLDKMSSDDFDKMMEEVDEELRKECIPIHERQLVAIGKISKRFKTSINLLNCEAGVPRRSANDNVWSRIDSWYKRRYGDRLRIDMSLGQTVALIRNDPYRVNIPLVLGSVRLYYDPSTVGVRKQLSGRYNIFNAFEGLTSAYAHKLSRDEVKILFEFFVSSMIEKHKLYDVQRIDFPREISNLLHEGVGDLETSIDHIFDRSLRYGQCRWLSLQAAEKFLKAYIASHKSVYPKSHYLVKELGPSATRLGWTEPIPGLLQKTECTPGVRYGEEASTLKEAVEASQSALKICSSLAEHMLRAQGHPEQYLGIKHAE